MKMLNQIHLYLIYSSTTSGVQVLCTNRATSRTDPSLFSHSGIAKNEYYYCYAPNLFSIYRLNYILDGGTFNAKFYHLTNLILHSTCSALSVAVFCFITGERKPRLSFVSALIFAIHPVHTEAVIICRIEV